MKFLRFSSRINTKIFFKLIEIDWLFRLVKNKSKFVIFWKFFFKVCQRGLKSIPLSVDLWIYYLSYVKSAYADNEERVRAEFEKAIDECGLEFRSDKLWDAYIKWETDGKRYNKVLGIYDRLVAVPTQGYSTHFNK